jgi:hypothetical protein
LFNERGEQVEESPLALVEILSPNHGATPWVASAVRLRRNDRGAVRCAQHDDHFHFVR